MSSCVSEQGETQAQKDTVYQSDSEVQPKPGTEAGASSQLLPSSTPRADYREIIFDKLTLDHRDRFYQQIHASVSDLIVVCDIDTERVSAVLDPRVDSKGYTSV